MEKELDHFYIKTEQELSAWLNDLETRGIFRVALDMEGDQGNIQYAYAISIIQVFDGFKPVVIDVLNLNNTDRLIQFLESEQIEKVMFASSNDQFMTQNVLNCTIHGIKDIAVAQRILGQPINLANYLGIEKKEKDHHQRANWIKRPISTELLNYAINDVMILMTLEDSLVQELEEKQLFNTYLNACKAISNQNYRINPLRLFSKRIGSYKYMKPDKRHELRSIWIFREFIGKKLNKPVGHLFSKKLMPFWVRKKIDVIEEVKHLVNKRLSPDKQLSHNELEKLWEDAWEMARQMD